VVEVDLPTPPWFKKLGHCNDYICNLNLVLYFELLFEFGIMFW
jgi:hypothetical protein